MQRALDERMMRRCIELARAASARGNAPVGCVITIEGEPIAEAEEECPAGEDPFGHAEILAVESALRTAGQAALTNATLYTTKEPCFLCSYAIREANIGRVVFAVETPGTGGATSDYPILSASNIEPWGGPPQIESGLLAEEYQDLRRELGSTRPKSLP